MITLSISSFRNKIADITNKVVYGGERVRVERNHKPAFAVVSVEDMEALEALEDKIDLEEALKALKEPGSIRLEDLKKKLGI